MTRRFSSVQDILSVVSEENPNLFISRTNWRTRCDLRVDDYWYHIITVIEGWITESSQTLPVKSLYWSVGWESISARRILKQKCYETTEEYSSVTTSSFFVREGRRKSLSVDIDGSNDLLLLPSFLFHLLLYSFLLSFYPTYFLFLFGWEKEGGDSIRHCGPRWTGCRVLRRNPSRTEVDKSWMKHLSRGWDLELSPSLK